MSEPVKHAVSESFPEYFLQRDRRIIISGLLLLTMLAWIYLLTGAGMNMGILDMTRLTLLPHRNMEMHISPSSDWTLIQVNIVLLMWWIMMIAMMLPSASPVILLYARVLRHTSADSYNVILLTIFFISGYLLIWLLFSIIATGMQWWLEQRHWLSMLLASNNGWLSGGLLITVGIYQLTPLKQACLKHCRSPVHFISNYMKPGKKGALQMGIEHGIFCVGCCWLLMALLFVGGVMNLVWIAVITMVVMTEKIFTHGIRVSRLSAVLLVVWGLAVLNFPYLFW